MFARPPVCLALFLPWSKMPSPSRLSVVLKIFDSLPSWPASGETDPRDEAVSAPATIDGKQSGGSAR